MVGVETTHLHLYLSPHLDDAVLSCGGQIVQWARAGERVRVVTVFAGDVPEEAARTAFVQELHARWGLGENPSAARRAEDVAACKVLGTEATHLDFPDCVYRPGRMGAPLYPTRDAIFGPRAEVEKGLIEEIGRALGRLGLPRDATVYLPLTVGRHVDHQIVREAGERWAKSRGAVRGLQIAYYEDYPYAESPEEVKAALDNYKKSSLAPRGQRTLARRAQGPILQAPETFRAEVVELDEGAMAAKVAAIACYRSQLDVFCGRGGDGSAGAGLCRGSGQRAASGAVVAHDNELRIERMEV